MMSTLHLHTGTQCKDPEASTRTENSIAGKHGSKGLELVAAFSCDWVSDIERMVQGIYFSCGYCG